MCRSACASLVGLTCLLGLAGWVMWGTGKNHEPAEPQSAALRAGEDKRALAFSCGPAALLAAAECHGKGGAARLAVILDQDPHATQRMASLYDLSEWARRAGFSPVGLKIDVRNLPRLPLPAVVHVEPDHFLALVEVDRDRVVVVDQGRRSDMPRSEFDRRFSGYVLCLTQFTASWGARG